MDELFTSDQFRLKPHTVPFFREELLISALDARRVGLSDNGQFGVFAIQPLFPGPGDLEFAVRLTVDPNIEQGNMVINQNFLASTGFQIDDERFWSVKRAPIVMPIQEAVIELVVEQGRIEWEIGNLRGQRRELFLQRCLMVEPNQAMSELSLPVQGRGYFNFRSIRPSPAELRTKSIFAFDDSTTLNLFVPHRRSGVDMVVVIDASGSMDLSDYIGADGRPHSRLEGVRDALDILFHRRLVSGSRVSRLAAVVFGGDTRMLFPPNEPSMTELREDIQLDAIRATVRDLSLIGLKRLGVDRAHTNISQAMQFAGELLDYYSQEGNEKALIVLSDGAHWSEDTENKGEGEIVTTANDPAVLADSLNYDSQVRIHTVAISNEQAFRRYIDKSHWNEGLIPNTKLLNKIADLTDGIFIESPDAPSLTRLFDELGEGTLYPV